MKIPSYPHVDLLDENKEMHPSWKLWFTQLITELQAGASDEGLVAPSQTNTTITTLLTTGPSGALVYNETTNKLMVNIAGTFKEVITT